MSEPMDEKRYPIKQSTAFAGSTLVTMGLVDLLAHLGPTGLLVSGLASYVAWRHGPELYAYVRGKLPSHASPEFSEPCEPRLHKRRRSVLERALGHFPDESDEEEDVAEPRVLEESGDEMAGTLDLPQASSAPVRLSIDEIVRHVKPNSYTICLGRSLTRPGAPAVWVSFKGRHLKLIGASHYGKSSMVAALLEMITRTHTTDHVLVALLDLEDQTSKLFADLPHVAEVITSGRPLLLYARTHDEVLTCLRAIVQVINLRYSLSKTDLLHEPILLVYLEEFIALKDSFKLRIDAVGRDEKEQARRDYANLVYCIKEIARRGLKVRVQLLLCAQVDYRDDDLQEALINVTAGMSLCVRVSAAQAAGFYHTELLTRNAKDDKLGQMVVEMPDCKDLVLAPDYDLGGRLLALEARELAQARQQGRGPGLPFLVPAHSRHSMPPASQPFPFTEQASSSFMSQIADAGNPGKREHECRNSVEVASQGVLPEMEPLQPRPHAFPVSVEEQRKPEMKRIPLGKDVSITEQEFMLAVKLRKAGMSTGYRDLMPIFDLSEHHAKALNTRIRETLGHVSECESE